MSRDLSCYLVLSSLIWNSVVLFPDHLIFTSWSNLIKLWYWPCFIKWQSFHFRRACLQVLESKIAPILAGIIAYLDTNHNLDLLTQTESPWKQQIWLTMLNTPESLQLTYDYLQVIMAKFLFRILVYTDMNHNHDLLTQTVSPWKKEICVEHSRGTATNFRLSTGIFIEI